MLSVMSERLLNVVKLPGYQAIGRALATATLLLLQAACSQSPQQSLDIGSEQAQAASQGKNWQCEANQYEQWRCQNLQTGAITEPPPPETYDIPAPNQSAVMPDMTSPPLAASTAVPVAGAADIKSPQSLPSERPDNAVVIQILAAHKLATLEQYINRYPTLDFKQLTLKEEPALHLLVLGPYPSVAEAKAFVKTIQPPLKDAPWYRSLRTLLPNIISDAPLTSDNPAN